MSKQHGSGAGSAFVMRTARGYLEGQSPRKRCSMFVSFLLALLSRQRAFTWSPSLDLSDNGVYSTLLPGSYL